jgi:hypothetical protein
MLQTTMRAGIGCYRSRPCWTGSWRLLLALSFPSALVSMWRANLLLSAVRDEPRLVALDDRVVVAIRRRHAAKEPVPLSAHKARVAQKRSNGSSSSSSSPAAAVSRRGRVVQSQSPYAYVFLMGFVDPDKPAAYKPHLAGISIAAYLLRKYGSRQDMVLYIMMSEFSKHPTLPDEDFLVLDALNVTVRQIPTVSNQTFHRLQLQKFRALGLAQYRRVMYMDSDVLPLVNLDVLFKLSDPHVRDPPPLKENLVFVDYAVPSNGGIWMLAPHEGDLQHVNGWIREAQVLRNQGVEGREPWRRYAPQPWEALTVKSDKYEFYAVSGDQGLLLSWVRHYRRTYSHVIKGGKIVNYVPDENDTHAAHVESTIPPLDMWPADMEAWGTDRTRLVGTHADFGHGGAFQGFHHFINDAGKPWYDFGCVESDRWDKEKRPVSEEGPDMDNDERAVRFWCQTFVELDAMYNSTVQLNDLHNTPRRLRHSDPSKVLQWATEGPITNLLEPDFDPRDWRVPNPTK